VLPRLNTFAGLVHLEYQDLLNSKYYSALRAGGELRFFEMIAIRLGYYRETQEDFGYDINRDFIEDVTYGFGAELPLDVIGPKGLPVRIKVDITKLEQPSYTKGTTPWGDFTVYSLSANWGY
jgi:hypothetical protein